MPKGLSYYDLVTILVSFGSLAVSLLSYLTARRAAQASERSSRAATDSLEHAKEVAARDIAYSCVLSGDTSNELDQPLKHLSQIRVRFYNNSKHATAYRIRVCSTGVGVFWRNTNINPKLLFDILLDRTAIVVPSGDHYSTAVYIVYAQSLPETATLTILVNDEEKVHREYVYELSTNTYVPAQLRLETQPNAS